MSSTEPTLERADRQWDAIRAATLVLCLALWTGTVWLASTEARAARGARAARRQAAVARSADVSVYSDGLAPGWQDWSWAAHALKAPEVNFHGKAALRMEPQGFRGVYLHCDGLDTSTLLALWVWVYGGALGGQKVNVCAVDASRKFLPAIDLGRSCVAGRIPPARWTLAVIPLGKLRARGTRITGFVFQDALGSRQSPVYLAEIKVQGAPRVQRRAHGNARQSPVRLVGTKEQGAPPLDRARAGVTVVVDLDRDVHPISRLIYGMAGGDAALKRDLRVTCERWGGNPSSRYNWVRGNCWNAARDWEFRNGNYGNTSARARQPSGVADATIAENQATGATTLLTIPTLGFVARDDDNQTRSIGVPSAAGKPVYLGSAAIAGYDPAANRRRTSVPSYARKRAQFVYEPTLAAPAVYQDEWVAHLVRRFGRAAEGGVRFYAMDNEPDLWASTHTDVHPVLPDYDELLATFLEYASAVKDVDPTAQVTGPVSWGWTGYFHSPRDTGDWNRRPDRRAHGDMPFIPWFLQQVRRHDQRAHRRTLDVLDVHYYPQAAGVYSGASDDATNALRLRSTRGLWDSTYSDESWIHEPVKLIPRMRDWITRYYPGTKLGITEWNWGADRTMNGALAIAECLGVLGREGVDLANYWTVPPARSSGYYAFKMYRNADGAGRGFGDRSVRAISSDPDRVSCFGAIDTRTGEPTVMLLNEVAPAPEETTVTVRLSGSPRVTTAAAGHLTSVALWQYGGTAPPDIRALAARPLSGAEVTVRLPAYSITLMRFQRR